MPNSLYLENLYRAFEEFIELLESHEINTQRSRLPTYKTQLSELISQAHKYPLELSNAQTGDYINLINEATSIAEILPYARAHWNNKIKNKIKEAIKGPPSPDKEKPESSSDLARNTLFELATAAKAARGGLLPLLEDPTDVSAKLNGGQLFIECKRLQKHHGFHARIKDGTRQIKDAKLALNNNAIGILAVSIGKAFSEGKKIIIINNESELNETCQNICRTFIKKHHERITPRLSEKLDGLMLDLNMPAYHASQKRIIVISYISFYMKKEINSDLAEQTERAFRLAMDPQNWPLDHP